MDYAQMKVGEIRDELVRRGMTIQEATDIKGKGKLVAALEAQSVPELPPEIPLNVSIEEGQELLNSLDGEIDLGTDDDIDDLLSGLGGDDIDDLSIMLGEEPEPLIATTSNEKVDQFGYDDNPYVDRGITQSAPEMMSVAYDDVMDLFEESELADGKYPRAAGLRRVAQLIIGKIVKSGPTQVIMGVCHQGLPMSTVVYELVFENGIAISDIADCQVSNTPDTFAVHPSASASTRAEGRALRKVLGISVTTAEEMNNDKDATEMLKVSTSTGGVRNMMDELDDFAKDTISPTLVAAITAKCTAFGIDVEKFINKKFYIGKDKKKAYADIQDVPHNVAQAMLKEINSYQGTEQNDLSKDIPEEIKV